MNALSDKKTLSSPQDELFEMERRIARRADELTRQFGTKPLSALDHWRRAEEEVWSGRLDLRRQEDSGRVIGKITAV